MSLQSLHCLNYGQGKSCTLPLKVRKKIWGNQVSGQQKTFRLRTSLLHLNILIYVLIYKFVIGGSDPQNLIELNNLINTDS